MPIQSLVVRAIVARRARALAAQHPAEPQRRELARLVARAAGTRFGRDHGFARVRGVEDFQRAVPLRDYDAFWRDYWSAAWPVLDGVSWPGRMPYFALSSGTSTGATKRIPVSREMVAANRRAGADVLAHHFAADPRSPVLGGKSFMLGGSTAFERPAPGVAAGDLSGIAADTLPWYARPLVFPPRDLALLADWEAKLERLARAALDLDIRILSGTPSWVLILLERLVDLRRARGESGPPLPGLRLMLHGGVAFGPYAARFRGLLGDAVDFREVYPASEGFVAAADRGPGEGMRAIVDNGLFFEFVPVGELGAPSPTRHWIATVETGVDYAIALSSCAGLWSYLLGDTVRFVGRDPPRLLFTGRVAHMLSAFGEHVIVEELDAAVTAGAAAAASEIADYAAGAVLPAGGEARGRHVFVVEFAAPLDPPRRASFLAALDAELARRNEDYRAHRAGDVGMAPPELVEMPRGGFARWMKARGKLGGQNKVPRVVGDPALLDSLLAAARGG